MSNVTEQFKGKFAAALANKKDALAELNGFLKKEVVADSDLVGCFRLYLTAFSQERRAKLDPDTQQRDRAIGYSLWSRTIELASALNGFADLAPFADSTERGEPADARKNLHPPRALTDLPGLSSHWRDLSFSNPVDPRPEIVGKSEKKRKELRDARTMLSPLIDAYRLKEKKSPTLSELLDFDPADDTLRKEFDQIALACDTAWRKSAQAKPTEQAFREVNNAFDRFGAFLKQKATEPLVFFQVLKWVREGAGLKPKRVVGDEKDMSTPSWSIVWHELYLEASFHAFAMAVTKWGLLSVQKAKSFPPEDVAFFLSALKDRREREKLEVRLTRGFFNLQGFIEFNRNRRRNERFAARASLTLLDEIESAKLMNDIAREKGQRPEAIRKRYVRVTTPAEDVFRDRYRVGQSIMDDFTIVWIEPSKVPGQTVVTIEFHHMDCILFRTSEWGLDTLVRNAFYKMLARNAEALKAFLLAYLELLGLIADVLTAGAAGGFRRFVFEFAKERFKEKVLDKGLDAAGIDNPALRALAGAGANLAHVPKRGSRGARAELEGGPDPSAQRAAAIGDRGVTPREWTAAEQAAMRQQGITDLSEFRSKQAGRGGVAQDTPRVTTAPAAGADAPPARASKEGDLDLSAQRTAGIGDRRTSAEWATPAEQAALREQEVADINEFAKKKKAEQGAVVQDVRQATVASAAGAGGGGTSRPTQRVITGTDRGVSVGSRSVSSSRTPTPPPRRPAPNHVPEPHPYTPHPPSQYDIPLLYLFYTRNIKHYPPHVQDMIRKLPAAATGRAATKTDFENIDRAIRKEHTDAANRLAGYGRKAEKPFINSVRANSNEGNRFNSMVTDQKGLSLIGQLKSGGTAEFDSIGFSARQITETKMNLRFKTQDDVLDQMRRQAQFADDWGFSQVRWEVWDPKDVLKTERARLALEQTNPNLAARIEVVNPEAVR